MAGYKPAYTIDEEQRILKYIIDNEEYYRVKGDAMWGEMAALGDFERSWQSLKNHFLKHMVNHLHYLRFNLSPDQARTIRSGYEFNKKTGTKKAIKKPANSNKNTTKTNTPSTSKSKKPFEDFDIRDISSDDD